MIQGSFPLWVLKNKCTISELLVKNIYTLRAGAAAALVAAAAASSEGEEVVPERRVRLYKEISPRSCQEPRTPQPWRPVMGDGGETER